MLKPKGRVLVLVFFCCWLLEFESLAQSSDPKEGTAMVSGRVTLKGEPLRGAYVALQSQSSFRQNQNPRLRSKTDAGGGYRLTGIPAGRYILSAMVPGLVSQDDDYRRLQGGRVINLAEGEQVENLDIELRRGSVITGRATDANGQPIAEESVSLSKIDENDKPQQFFSGLDFHMYRTDDRGIYRLYGLPAGRYQVSIGIEQREGGNTRVFNRKYYQKTYHPDATDRSKATVIELGEGEEATGIDISAGEAKKIHEVSGRVVDADTGQPVPAVDIQCGIYHESGLITRVGGPGERSGPRGEFRLTGLTPGKYAVFVSSNMGPVGEPTEYYSDATPVDVGDGNVGGIEIKARLGASIGGSVVVEGTNEPATLAKLSRSWLSANAVNTKNETPVSVTGKIYENGSFRLAGLRPGKMLISMGGFMGENWFSIVRIERGGVPQQREIEIKPGEQIDNLRVVVGYGTATLHGQLNITGMTMSEIGRVGIYLTRSGGLRTISSSGEVDDRGRFMIEKLLPGEYEARINYYYQPNQNKANQRSGQGDGQGDGQGGGQGDRLQRMMNAIHQFKQMVTIGGAENQVTLTLDLTQNQEQR